MDKTAPNGIPPNIEATHAHEQLHKRVDVLESDLAYKYQPMRDSIFAVLRGTFYRWASRWEETSPDFAKAPRVMAVGDLHEFWNGSLTGCVLRLSS